MPDAVSRVRCARGACLSILAALLALAAVPAAAQDLQALPANIDFGPVDTGQTHQAPLQLQNNSTGGDLIEILDVEILPEVSDFDHNFVPPIPLTPGQSIGGTIFFTPATEGPHNADLRVVYLQNDETVELLVPLAGEGVDPPPPAEPNIRVTPSRLGFGEVDIEQTENDVILITNTGDAPLNVNAITLLGDDANVFEVDDDPRVIPPDQTQPIEVRFTPFVPGHYAAFVRIESDDPDNGSVDVEVEGTGIPLPFEIDFGPVRVGEQAQQQVTFTNDSPDVIMATAVIVNDPGGHFSAAPAAVEVPPNGEGAFTLTYAPRAAGGHNATLRIESPLPTVRGNLEGRGTEPGFGLSTNLLDFGTLAPGATETLTVEMLNTGDSPLTVLSTEIAEKNGAFSITQGAGRRVIPAGERRPIGVTFAPLTVGTFEAVLEIETDDPARPQGIVTLRGASACALAATPAGEDFGDVRLGQTATAEVTVQHSCGTSVTIQAVLDGPAAFGTDASAPFVVEPGAARTLGLSFTPEARDAVPQTAVLRLESTDLALPVVEVSLAGRGVAPRLALSAEALGFGMLTVGRTTSRPLTLTNQGNAELTVSSLAISGAAAGAFGLADAAGFPLGPGQMRTLLLRFTAGTAGPQAATLTITSDDPDAPTQTVGLAGEGVALTFEPPVDAAGAAPVDLELTVPADLADAGGTLFYATGGDDAFTALPLARDGATFRGTIPAEALTLRGVLYYIVFQLGEESFRLPAEGCPYQIRVAVPRLEPPFALVPGQYQMISWPLELADRLLTTQLFDDFGTYDPEIWRALRWHAGDQEYREFGPFSRLGQRHHAGWLITRDATTFDVEQGRSPDLCTAYELVLRAGWNQIATPYPFALSWPQVAEGAPVRGLLYGFDGANYVPGLTLMEPWRGYFVFAEADATISVLPRPAGAAAKHTAGELFSEADFVLRLRADLDGTALHDPHTYVGFARNGAERLAWPDPPPPGDHLRVNIVRDGRRLLSAFEAPGAAGAAWDLDVEAVRAGPPRAGTVTIRLDERGARPPGFSLHVLDRDDGTAIPVDEGQFRLSLSRERPVRRLRLVLGTAAFAGDEQDRLVPAAFALDQNYPNPFNPETLIGYRLAEARAVRLDVFDLLGRRVRRLVAAEQAAGHHQTRWDGRDDAGRPVASGVYVYRLQAGSFVQTRTMTLLR